MCEFSDVGQELNEKKLTMLPLLTDWLSIHGVYIFAEFLKLHFSSDPLQKLTDMLSFTVNFFFSFGIKMLIHFFTNSIRFCKLEKNEGVTLVELPKVSGRLENI